MNTLCKISTAVSAHHLISGAVYSGSPIRLTLVRSFPRESRGIRARKQACHREGRLAANPRESVSRKEFSKSFRQSQFPHKFVDSFFILVIVKDMPTHSWES